MNEEIVEEVRACYLSHKATAIGFHCDHLPDCKGDCENFTEALEPYIGREYGTGSVPRLLFLSLDPGKIGDDRKASENRTIESQRRSEERDVEGDGWKSWPENKHWNQTHELALTLLRSFDEDLDSVLDVSPYFAHTQAAKCCMNNWHRSEAAPRLFDHCRALVAEELVAFQPDILVTQGDKARDVLIKSGLAPRHKDHGLTVLDLNGRQVIWIHSYHPGSWGGRQAKEREACWEQWAKAVRVFIDTRDKGAEGA